MTYREFVETELECKEQYQRLNNPSVSKCREEGCPFSTPVGTVYGCDYISFTGCSRSCQPEECCVKARKQEYEAVQLRLGQKIKQKVYVGKLVI